MWNTQPKPRPLTQPSFSIAYAVLESGSSGYSMFSSRKFDLAWEDECFGLMSECLVVASNSGRADKKALSLPPGVVYRMWSEGKALFLCVVKRAPLGSASYAGPSSPPGQ
eukprot:scaffold1996_cov65-Phaeocystis_antarctica.AAC.1